MQELKRLSGVLGRWGVESVCLMQDAHDSYFGHFLDEDTELVEVHLLDRI